MKEQNKNSSKKKKKLDDLLLRCRIEGEGKDNTKGGEK